MTRKWLGPVMCLLMSPCQADLTMSGHSVTIPFGTPVTSQEKIWIKKGLVRRDYTERGRIYSQLFDLNNKKLALLDHFAKVAELYDLEEMNSESAAKAPATSMTMKLEATGKSRPLQSWTCKEHNLRVSIPAKLGTEETIFHLDGKLWLASGVPEQVSVKMLHNLARKPDFFIGTPSAVIMAPAQAQSIKEIIRKLAGKGLPCAAELEGSDEGNGPMVNLARKLPSRAGINFEQFAKEEVDQAVFVIPNDYRVMQKQMPLQNSAPVLKP